MAVIQDKSIAGSDGGRYFIIFGMGMQAVCFGENLDVLHTDAGGQQDSEGHSGVKAAGKVNPEIPAGKGEAAQAVTPFFPPGIQELQPFRGCGVHRVFLIIRKARPQGFGRDIDLNDRGAVQQDDFVGQRFLQRGSAHGRAEQAVGVIPVQGDGFS